MKRNIDYLIGSATRSLGSVVGSLDAVTLHNRNEFRIWHQETRKPVTCRFRKKMLTEVLEHLQQDVLVYGEITRNTKGEPVLIVVDGMEPRPSSAELPSIRKMSGFLEDVTDGKPLKDYMEELRDG